ncbi:hypothetical protein [Acetobacterium wieringae]|uniref:hypothetical protein n=1 Tax=Acetobacterium wieringae TaxID=52694 RepID=UPI003158239B
MTDFERGYQFLAESTVAFSGANKGSDYVSSVQEALNKTIDEMKSTTIDVKINSKDAFIKGFVAEDWHAGTFNADVAAKGGKTIFAAVDKSNHQVNDIIINNNGQETGFQLKFYNSAEATAKAISDSKYDNVGKVAPSDQVESGGIRDYAHKEALRNQEIRPDVSKSYAHTAENARATIEEAGFSSKGLTDEQALKIVKDMKKDSFDPKDYGLVTENFIKAEYIMQQALKAGLTAAAISAVVKLAPEICKIIMELISTGAIDQASFIEFGLNAVSAPVEGFINGSVAAGITATFASGLLGETLKAVTPVLIATASVILMHAIQNSFFVATGKMTKAEFADACARDIFLATCGLAGGSIGQALLPALPVIGFMLGSFVGGVIGNFAYTAGKSVCLSFCVESGFTFFGLVDQDYELPDEVIKELGIEIFEIDEFVVPEFELEEFAFDQFELQEFELETFSIKPLRRGVLKINHIGYV